MPAKAYLRILQGGLLASLLIVFFVFKDLLFPFITSKQLSFNILMEFLLAVWLVFIMRYPAYRPKKNYISYGLLVFFAAIIASYLVSVDKNLSFWGDAERMLGLFHLLHFLIFYFILVTVFRTWAQWRSLLFSSVLIATIISFIGLSGQGEVYATIGNTAYVSGYLIFNIFFALILFGRSQSFGRRSLYLLPIIVMLLEFWRCHTSGAIIGLFLSFLLLLFFLGLSHRNRALRRSSLLIFLLAVLAVIFVFSQYQAAWFQNSFLRNLTFEKSTFQTRLISWKSAALDFKYHPLFGTGFGNYAIIFDRHFDPKFFNYARTETYFDRAHNNLIDIASTTGLFGLAAYLSIFAAALYYLASEFKKNGGRAGTGEESSKKNLEILVLLALMAAYFIQNLAVFDSLVTYVGLMVMLGFIYWLIEEPAGTEEGDDVRHILVLSRQWEWVTLIILIFGAYLFAYNYNIRVWKMFQGVIVGYSDIVDGNLADGVLAYQKALVGTPLDRDGRTTLINLITIDPNMLDSLTSSQAQATLDYTISLAQENVSYNPQDSLMQMQLAQILDTAARHYYQDLDKFNYYSRQAIEAIDRSIEASPGRVPVYLVKAQMQLVRGEKEEALSTIDYAISLNPDYSEAYCRLAQFYVFMDSQNKAAMKDDKKLGDSLGRCVDLGGVDTINSNSLLVSALSYFTANSDYARALKLAERLSILNSDSAEVWLNLGKLYLLSGNQAGAETAHRRAVLLDPKSETDWADFLKTVEKTKATSSPVLKKAN